VRGADDRVHHASGVRFVDEHLDADLRQEVDAVLRPAVDLGVPALTPEASTWLTVIPWTPTVSSALFTSSTLNGLMTAVTSLIRFSPSCGLTLLNT